MSQVDVSVRGVPRPSWIAGLARFCRRVLEELDLSECELSVLLCNDAAIRKLNAAYRSRDVATDVLSFRQADKPTPGSEGTAGDLVISLETLRKNANAFGVSEEEESSASRFTVFSTLQAWITEPERAAP